MSAANEHFLYHSMGNSESQYPHIIDKPTEGYVHVTYPSLALSVVIAVSRSSAMAQYSGDISNPIKSRLASRAIFATIDPISFQHHVIRPSWSEAVVPSCPLGAVPRMW